MDRPTSQSNQRACKLELLDARWKRLWSFGDRGLWPDSNPIGVICPRALR